MIDILARWNRERGTPVPLQVRVDFLVEDDEVEVEKAFVQFGEGWISTDVGLVMGNIGEDYQIIAALAADYISQISFPDDPDARERVMDAFMSRDDRTISNELQRAGFGYLKGVPGPQAVLYLGEISRSYSSRRHEHRTSDSGR